MLTEKAKIPIQLTGFSSRLTRLRALQSFGWLIGLLFFHTHSVLAQFGPGLQAPFDNEYSQNITSDETSLTTLETMVSNLLGIVTTIGGLLFIVYFLLAGISWITSEGDSSKLEKARNKMIQAVLGLIVLVSVYGAVSLIGQIVGLKILDPAETLRGLIPN